MVKNLSTFAAGAIAAAALTSAQGAHAASTAPVNAHYQFTRIITQATPGPGGQCEPVGTEYFGEVAFPAANKTGYILHHTIPVAGILGDAECTIVNNGTYVPTLSGTGALSCSVAVVGSGGALQTLGPAVFNVTFNFLQVLKESYYETVSYFDPIGNCTYSGIDVGFKNK